MKKLILDSAWKLALQNPHTEELLKPGVYTLLDTTTGIFFTNVSVQEEVLHKNPLRIPTHIYFFMYENKRYELNENFCIDK